MLKEYISCKFLEYGLHFDVGGLYYCAQSLNANETHLPIVSRNTNCADFYKEFFKIKTENSKGIKNGILPKRCINCIHLERKNWEKSHKIKYIGIFANKNCNINCIYCSTHQDKEFYNSIKDMPVYEFLKELINKRKLSKGCQINFAGGEPTLHYEFDKVLNLITKESYDYFIRIHTNATVYKPIIAKLLSENRINIITSLDSCNRELYKKVKNADLFDEVINNLQKYSNNQKDNNIILKYIIIPNVNDKEEYILKFIDLVKKIGCKFACCDIDAYWYNDNKNNIKEINRINDLCKFFKINFESKT